MRSNTYNKNQAYHTVHIITNQTACLTSSIYHSTNALNKIQQNTYHIMQFMISINSYMLWHHSAIFRESTKTKGTQSNMAIQVLMKALQCQNMWVDISLWLLFYYLCFIVFYWVHSVGWYTEHNKMHGMCNTKLAYLTFTSVLFHRPLSVSTMDAQAWHKIPVFTSLVPQHPSPHISTQLQWTRLACQSPTHCITLTSLLGHHLPSFCCPQHQH